MNAPKELELLNLLWRLVSLRLNFFTPTRKAVGPSKPIYQLNGSISGMRTSIDRAGRLVIPKALRDQAGITAGDVEISLDGAAIRIEGVTADELVEQDGLLLLPAGGPELDSDQVRELRLADQR